MGLVFDPKGDGKMTVRASYGIFYDNPHLFFNTRFANNPPWGAQITLSNPAGGLTDPYQGFPGGNPFPALANISPNSFFPLAGIYVNAPLDIKPTYLQQWNLSVQRQVGEWLFAGNYLGNKSTHLWTGREANPAVQLYDDPTAALEWYTKSLRTSRKNGWTIVYDGLPLQG